MINREIYQRDPSTSKLVNEGVAEVNDEKMAVLRYELETFVCSGQYEKGLELIITTYLKNINQAQQPAVWISGFYGSGKSHLVKMLRALWNDTVFADGATARGIANLPQNIKDLLLELSTEAKRHGGLHAASGKLESSARGSVRLALLSIIFKSVNLPEKYPIASFALWLKKAGIYEIVKKDVEQQGFNWKEQLGQFYVADPIHEALIKEKPNTFPSSSACTEILMQLYPPDVKDISSDELIKAIQDAISINGEFPLTLIVLDEIQQYISEDSQLSLDVQEVVESCGKHIGGKLMFIGTGQTAITGTANLKKLAGRFPVRIELSDSDVDAVVREVILAKKPNAVASIDQTMQANLGEISRHLQETTIGHRSEDKQDFPMDYPILPIRRRFWEKVLRVLDQTGTDSQLRNQLSMVHKAIQMNLDEPLGHVIPADYLYFNSIEDLLTSGILSRELYDMTITLAKGSDDEKLIARACGLVFLINKLADNNNEIGIKANVDSIADLLVDNISKGSSSLRSKLPGLLDNCELLMNVDDVYRIRTKESSEWTSEFRNHRTQLANEAHRIENERHDRIRHKFGEYVKDLSIPHGNSKVIRTIYPVFDSSLPSDCNEKICLWIRDGWSVDDNSVIAEARQAGNESPTIFVFIPKRSANDFRHQLMEYKAAVTTLDKRGVPNTNEGKEARASIETIKQRADGKIKDLLDDIFSGSRVFQGNGNEILGNDLQSMVLEAANNSLGRLYPKFDLADNPGWEKVYSSAKAGSSDALKAVDYNGDPADQPVCKAILNFIAAGKLGTDIRNKFEYGDYGWSRDAVDGALQTLLVAGIINAQDDRGQVLDPKQLERKAIGKTTFKVESAVLSPTQRIAIRNLFKKAGCLVKPGEELSTVPQFLENMYGLANNAGGEAPKPNVPNVSILEQIKLKVGNEQLLLIHNHLDEITNLITEWDKLAVFIKNRWSSWETLDKLVSHVDGIPTADNLKTQVQSLKDNRLLLANPDQIAPLISDLTQLLRNKLNELDSDFKVKHSQGMNSLVNDSNWSQLKPEQQNNLLVEQKLDQANFPTIDLSSTDGILKTLSKTTISMLGERVAAIPSRFDAILIKAAKLMIPQAHPVQIPRRTLMDENAIDEWVDEVKKQLKSELSKGPITIQ